MANITQIAATLGIAPSTVSRALKKPSLVSLETRRAVLQEAERTGYIRKLQTDANAASSSNIIGVIVADLTNSFSNQIVKSVHDTLDGRGYSAIIGCSYESSGSENRLLKQWASMNLKGLIVMPSDKLSKTNSLYEGIDLPVVFVDRESRSSAHDSVIEDNRFGISLATEHLTQLGHQRICLISGNRKIYTFDERCQGACESYASIEISQLKAESYEELFVEAFEQTNILMLRPKGTRPTAIIGANNAITSGILYALSLKNFSIPKDVSVLSYGDSNFCRYYPTPVTSICQPIEEMGRVSAQLLLERIDSPGQFDAKRICLKSMLMRRASTAQCSM
ncbi:MAG: LacI family DNA-binding transcriptional regulator [Succinivibrio sp.]